MKKYEKIWITKEGVEIPVKKLTDKHIKNILKYFNGEEVFIDRAEMLDLVKDEAKKRGISETCEYDTCHIYSTEVLGFDPYFEND